MESAQRTDAIVSDLFPSEFRDRLLTTGGARGASGNGVNGGGKVDIDRLKITDKSSKPLADLFPIGEFSMSVQPRFDDVSFLTV